jgi:H+/gluconate symporter-like permease
LLKTSPDQEKMNEDADEEEEEEENEEEEEKPKISQQEILEIWHEIVPILNNEVCDYYHSILKYHQLHFTTFRNALANNVKSIFFQGNSLLSMMSNVADLPPPEQV